MGEAEQGPIAAGGRHMAEQPDDRCTTIRCEDGVGLCVPCDQSRDILRMDGTATSGRTLAERVAGFASQRQHGIEEVALGPLPDLWQQGSERVVHVADRAERDRVAASEMTAVDVDLDDPRLVRIELPPGEVAAK